MEVINMSDSTKRHLIDLAVKKLSEIRFYDEKEIRRARMLQTLLMRLNKETA
jgi:hypothetical protein